MTRLKENMLQLEAGMKLVIYINELNNFEILFNVRTIVSYDYYMRAIKICFGETMILCDYFEIHTYNWVGSGYSALALFRIENKSIREVRM